MTKSTATRPQRRRTPATRNVLKGALALSLGLGLVGWLVQRAGAQNVWLALGAARWAVGICTLLELAVLACDALAGLSLVSAQRPLDRRHWLRGSVLAYASAAILPSGRAAGEVVRATTFAPQLGAVHAAQTGARLQAIALLANGATSAVGAAAIGLGLAGSRLLVLALSANGVVCSLLGAAVLYASGHPRTAGWLSRIVGHYAPQGLACDHAQVSGRAKLRAFAWCVAGRGLQTLEHSVLLFAVGGALGAVPALASQAVQLVGAAIGDFVPAQLGATEAAYRMFAGTLGLSGRQADVLVIALGLRLAQLIVSAACMCAALALSWTTQGAQNIKPSAT